MIELMISLVLGLLVMAAVLSVYVSTLQSSALSLNASRLNQESEAILNVMANEIRRAGYDGDYNKDAPYSNDFNDISNATYVQVLDFNSVSGSCIVYTYDHDASNNSDGAIQNEELKGFRLSAASSVGIVEMRTSSDSGSLSDFNDCTKGTWEKISDESVINVTSLVFSMSDSQCINITAGVAVSGADCTPGGATMAALVTATTAAAPSAATPFRITHKRNVAITYKAELVSDDLIQVNRELVGSDSRVKVKVRNDLLFEYP